ncbi:MAG: PKD domain-containing protein, partial [Bacteroidota bacterium]
MPLFYSRVVLFLLCLFVFAGAMDGQDIRISQGGRVNSCSGTFLDSGGNTGNHVGPGESRTITICPAGGNSGGTHVELLFSEFQIAGTMTIYNGDDTNADVLTSLSGAANETAFRSRATAANTSGCLTINFENNGTETRSGWVASVNCVVACQPIEAVLLSANPAPMPDATGYIDVCPGTPITLSGTGNYPEDGVIYAQSDANSTFIWNFQDGTVQTGQTVTHTYDEPGGFVVQLIIEDSRGCRNSNRISQRVRVAPPPVFGEPANLPSAICVGEEVPVTIDPNGGTGVSFTPAAQEFSFNTSQTFTELTFLPDGTGTEYSSPLLFSNFDPGQTLRDGADLVRICARMEHSYLGDLDIWIECPNGNRLDLHTFQQGNGVSDQLLGQGNENTTSPDPPGTYCWTATAPRTMTQVVNRNNIGEDESLPEIDYAPEENFSSLEGCELNGEWSLHIRDNLAVDNGYIYEWSIEFERDVYPDQETFSVPINQLNFRADPNFAFYTADSIVLQSANPGVQAVTIESIDDYFCVYDTTVHFEVLPPFDPACRDCGSLVSRNQLDTSICRGESFTPNVARNDLTDTTIVWVANAPAAFGNSLFPDESQALALGFTVSSHSPATIGDVTADIESVCVNLENDGNLSDVTLQLVAPNGRTINLLENFGGNGENLSQTCFSPAATAPLNGGSAPYTGTFQITAGDWSGLNGAPTNGDWQLRAWDEAGNDL